MRKQTCANCHFFVRQHHGDRGTEHTFEIGATQRAQAAHGDFSWQRDTESIACFKGVWDEGAGLGEPGKVAAVSQQSRRNKCYFFSYQPGMLLPAAEKLQQERAAASSESRKYRLAVYSLAVAVIALLVKLVFGA